MLAMRKPAAFRARIVDSAAWTRTFNHNFQILDAVFFHGVSATLCCNLSCKRSGFARTTETGTTGCCPTQRVTDDQVIVTMVLLKEA